MCQSADCVHNLQIAYAIHAIWGSGIAHEFRLHAHAASYAHAASSSDISAFATMSTSAEEQHRKLSEEFCTWKYAAARSKTISQLEVGSESNERCDAGGGAQVRRTI